MGRKTEAVSPRRRARTKRPTAWAKKSGVEVDVAYTPTASRGTSTPSETIRTATIQRDVPWANSSIRAEAPLSSESTTVAGSPVSISYAPSVERETKKALKVLSFELGLDLTREADANFAAALAAGKYDAGVGARVRVVGTLPAEVREKLAPRPEVALLDDAVTSSGRVELRYWVKEQSVSMTLHRFGNPSRRFHDLARELKK